MQYIFTATPRLVDTQYGFEGVEIGAIRITWTRVIGAVASLAAFAGLYAVLRHTQFGRAMRAIAQNREAALMVGIRPKVVARNAVVLAAGLCGLAGAAIAPIQLVTPYMGQFLIFKAFALVIIGGLGNIPGAIVAAIGLGLIENWIGGFFEIAWQEGAVFVIMIVVCCSCGPTACSSAGACGSDEARRRTGRGARSRRLAVPHGVELHHRHRHLGADLHGRGGRPSISSTAIRGCCRSPSSASGGSAATPRRSRW